MRFPSHDGKDRSALFKEGAMGKRRGTKKLIVWKQMSEAGNTNRVKQTVNSLHNPSLHLQRGFCSEKEKKRTNPGTMCKKCRGSTSGRERNWLEEKKMVVLLSSPGSTNPGKQQSISRGGLRVFKWQKPLWLPASTLHWLMKNSY